jgi:hypothetical protein
MNEFELMCGSSSRKDPVEDTMKQVNNYLDKQIKELREENARLTAARITDMGWSRDQCAEIVNTYMRINEGRLKAEKAELMEIAAARGKLIDELEGALLRQTVIVRYYAGDFVCECGWVVDAGICGDSKFNYCPGCGSKLDFMEVEK